MDGPCLIIEWRDQKHGVDWLTSLYYPDKDTSSKAAEMACFEWFKQRRCEIRSMTWGWGPVSPHVFGQHRMVIGRKGKR